MLILRSSSLNYVIPSLVILSLVSCLLAIIIIAGWRWFLSSRLGWGIWAGVLIVSFVAGCTAVLLILGDEIESSYGN